MKKIVITITVLAIIGVTSWYLFSKKLSEPREKVTLGVSYQTVNALTIIALKQGFFAEQGLDLVVREYPTGKRALEGMLAGETEISQTASTPLVLNSFKHEPFRILAEIGETGNEFKIVALRNSNIFELKDLAGKKIATQGGSDMHFFLSTVMKLNGVKNTDVQIFSKKVEGLVPALRNSEVDAISVREPFITEAIKLLGENSLTLLSDPRATRHEFFMVALNTTIKNKPNVPKKIIRALLQAEKFAAKNPDQAATIVAESLKVDKARILAVWPDLNLKVIIKISTPSEFNNQALWAIENNLIKGGLIPNYRSYIYFDAIEEIAPKAITATN